MTVLRRIVDNKWVVQYPGFLKTNAVTLIQQFLEKKPTRRLGKASTVHRSPLPCVIKRARLPQVLPLLLTLYGMDLQAT